MPLGSPTGLTSGTQMPGYLGARHRRWRASTARRWVDGMPRGMRGVLHRAFDFIADSGDAARQAGGGSVPPLDGGLSLRAVWQAGAPSGLPGAAGLARDVRVFARRGAALFDLAGTRDGADPNQCQHGTNCLNDLPHHIEPRRKIHRVGE